MAGELWEFATTVYARSGVAAACIDLQDRFGVDVTYLLAAAWAGDCGVVVDRETLLTWDLQCAAWREQVVLPLRRQRRAWAEKADRDYQAIKALELDAERETLGRLEALAVAAPEKTASADGGDGDGRIRANIGEVLRFFFAPDDLGAGLAAMMMPAPSQSGARKPPD